MAKLFKFKGGCLCLFILMSVDVLNVIMCMVCLKLFEFNDGK